jgi:hypothetical protein
MTKSTKRYVTAYDSIKLRASRNYKHRNSFMYHLQYKINIDVHPEISRFNLILRVRVSVVR